MSHEFQPNHCATKVVRSVNYAWEPELASGCAVHLGFQKVTFDDLSLRDEPCQNRKSSHGNGGPSADVDAGPETNTGDVESAVGIGSVKIRRRLA
ncbi:unnamed protein product [Toxocara canis]|uniref:Uncharacterized protein n=1 Tax=Toxocara canis TaxID=6265 RepID=A0A183VFG0_TOXCA|nr:unnamed protein product [Toxocara canis]